MKKRIILVLFFIHSLFGSAYGDSFSYVFPVQPSRTAAFSKGGHSYRAIDIFSKKGTQFVSPVAGTVEDVKREDEWDRAANDPEKKGGRWVSILGDDGFRYYGSHLDKVADYVSVGKRVNAGDILGYVGDSGNAKGTPSHLHFGISSASRPYTWKVRKGEIEPYYFLECVRGKKCDPHKTLEIPAKR